MGSLSREHTCKETRGGGSDNLNLLFPFETSSLCCRLRQWDFFVLLFKNSATDTAHQDKKVDITVSKGGNSSLPSTSINS